MSPAFTYTSLPKGVNSSLTNCRLSWAFIMGSGLNFSVNLFLRVNDVDVLYCVSVKYLDQEVNPV